MPSTRRNGVRSERDRPRSRGGVVRVLHANGFPGAERRRVRRKDALDIVVSPGVVASVKGGKHAKTPPSRTSPTGSPRPTRSADGRRRRLPARRPAQRLQPRPRRPLAHLGPRPLPPRHRPHPLGNRPHHRRHIHPQPRLRHPLGGDGVNTLSVSDVDRFWSSVTKTTTCWLWTGETNSTGYGRFTQWIGGGRRRILTHRMSFWLANGSLPTVVRHACDTPLCVRPEHLLAGTQADNIRDAVERGRANHSGLAIPRERDHAAAGARVASGVKRCVRCGESKSFADFHKDGTSLDQRQRWCKACQRDHRTERRRAA
jgi:hypothetical protein